MVKETAVKETTAPRSKRVALYVRVSSGKQAEKEISIPDQLRQLKIYCSIKGWEVIEEYRDAKTGRDGNRPGLKALKADALGADKPYDLVLFYSFSRFYRNGLESELLIRELRENGVEVQSYTEQIGNDPVGDLCRRIISLFNEFLSDEIARHVKRSQKENARQGFWNGGPTPFGYRVVDAERRGDTIKKKLGIAPDEAEIVRAMFERYLTGDGAGGPSGVLRIAEWLNAEGYRTRNGARWGNSIVHRLLTDTTYKGDFVWDRDADDPDDRVVVPVPAIVAAGTFDKVARTLEARNPKKTPPRVTTGGNLLTGMATCSVCGSSMTTATGKSGAYNYYRCSRKNRQGAEACTNVNVPMADLNGLVIDALSSQLLDPESLAAVLEATHGRQVEPPRLARRAKLSKDALSWTARRTRRARTRPSSGSCRGSGGNSKAA